MQCKLEMRQNKDGAITVFTLVDGEPVRAASLHHLVYEHPEWKILDVPHDVHILWNGTPIKVVLHEIFGPAIDQYVSIRVQLNIEGISYETELCRTLQDAYWELQEMVAPNTLRLQTCFDCYFSWSAITGGGWDEHDELVCYRDAPLEAITEIHQRAKFASEGAEATGQYFVNAFHRCAAWRPNVAEYIGPS